jgi:hypothetical protein
MDPNPMRASGAIVYRMPQPFSGKAEGSKIPTYEYEQEFPGSQHTVRSRVPNNLEQ